MHFRNSYHVHIAKGSVKGQRPTQRPQVMAKDKNLNKKGYHYSPFSKLNLFEMVWCSYVSESGKTKLKKCLYWYFTHTDLHTILSYYPATDAACWQLIATYHGYIPWPMQQTLPRDIEKFLLGVWCSIDFIPRMKDFDGETVHQKSIPNICSLDKTRGRGYRCVIRNRFSSWTSEAESLAIKTFIIYLF